MADQAAGDTAKSSRRIEGFVNLNEQRFKGEVSARWNRLDQFDSAPSKTRNCPKSQLRRDIERQRRKLGDCSRFGEGDGSYWDRWLIAEPPRHSRTQGKGSILPQRGFKAADPERYRVPRHLIEQARKEDESQTEKTLTDLLAEETLIRAAHSRKTKANASAAAADTVAKVLQNSLSASHPTRDRVSSFDSDRRDTDSLDYQVELERSELRTDKAKAAALRFQQRVEASISSLKQQCALDTPK